MMDTPFLETYQEQNQFLMQFEQIININSITLKQA